VHGHVHVTELKETAQVPPLPTDLTLLIIADIKILKGEAVIDFLTLNARIARLLPVTAQSTEDLLAAR
jgi:hypothetical protein